MHYSYLFLLSCLAGITATTPALAYIGLGPGMTMIGSFFSLILAVLAVFLMVLLLPLRILLKRRKARKAANAKTTDNQTDGTA